MIPPAATAQVECEAAASPQLAGNSRMRVPLHSNHWSGVGKAWRSFPRFERLGKSEHLPIMRDNVPGSLLPDSPAASFPQRRISGVLPVTATQTTSTGSANCRLTISIQFRLYRRLARRSFASTRFRWRLYDLDLPRTRLPSELRGLRLVSVLLATSEKSTSRGLQPKRQTQRKGHCRALHIL